MAHTTKSMRKAQIWTLCVHYFQICVCEFILLCLYQYMTNKTHTSTHIHIQVIVKYWAWLASLTLIQKMLSDISTALKTFTETIKWMWRVVEEWWKSDGINRMQVDVKKKKIIMYIWLTEIWKCMESLFLWALFEPLTDTKNRKYSMTSPQTPGGSGLERLPSKCKF